MSHKFCRLKLVMLCLALSAIASVAQERTVTPVESDDAKPVQPTLHYYDKHGKLLDEPVMFLADLDTVQKVNAGPTYPLLTNVSVGLNIWDLAMNAFGQNYGGFDVWGELPLWNWLIPTAELGIGWANDKPKDGNFQYKGKPSFYAKLGANYNFLYKSNPEYRLFAGLRFGFSHFGYDIKNISITNGYWQQDNKFDITGQSSTAVYGELLAGIEVKIWKEISMGWTFRYHYMMHCPDASMSVPAYIPGYGSRNGSITASFSVIYTLPIKKFTIPEPKE